MVSVVPGVEFHVVLCLLTRIILSLKHYIIVALNHYILEALKHWCSSVMHMMNLALFPFNLILCLWAVDAALVKLPVAAYPAGGELGIFVYQYLN